MSKIPLAGENFRPEEELRARFKRNLIISLVALILLGGLIALIEYFALKDIIKEHLALHILGDAFGLSGILGLAGFGLGYVSSKGAFDLLSYSMKLLVLNVFAPKYRQENFPKTYYDYKVLKDHEERKAVFPLLWISLIFLAVGVVLVIIYSNLI
jgi:hypothetical protein